jgi:hypothetical protein
MVAEQTVIPRMASIIPRSTAQFFSVHKPSETIPLKTKRKQIKSPVRDDGSLVCKP